ncbi:MAG: HypC/HybG/HupF family hydrogenase formation chaperone [Lachnospiraceae bacterium]|nr:HypC/HybG/HupF family hydrogenase formation chaperone [Lachnospiraceae bacterium]
MCVALPGIVRKINDNGTAEVDFNGNYVNAVLGLVHAKVNDKVLVHAGCILQVISDKEADDLNELFDEIMSY